MTQVSIKRLSSSQSDFAQQLDALLAWESVSDKRVNQVVEDVIAQVKARGDQALVDYTNQFDRMQAQSMAELELSSERLAKALHDLPAEQRAALETAATRVSQYHERDRKSVV